MSTTVSYGGRLAALARRRGDDVAARHIDPDGGPDHLLTFAELDRSANATAALLAERGVTTDDRVAISMRNSPELLMAVFGAWKLGATPIPLRWDLPEWEADRVLDASNPAAHLTTTDDLAALTPLDAPPTPDAVTQHAFGTCSGGSTGAPKVILNTRTSVWNDAYGSCIMEDWRAVHRPQTILVLAPMYHANAFATLFYLLAGDPLVVLRRFDAATAVDAIERHGVTTFTATPTMLQRMADLPDIDDRDLTGLDWVLQGAASMPESLTRRWIDLIAPENLVMAYGMSEGLGLTALRGDEWLDHPGSVGRPIRGTEVRILDADGGDAAVGTVGDVYLRMPGGPSSRYLGDVEPLPTTEDGFRSGGDLGHLDAEGYLHLADRRTDLIVSGGANIYPAEVEAALIDHPAIADVVVIGLPDPEWGHRVHAVIEATEHACPPSLDDIVTHAKARVAPYKVPKSIDIVATMPRTAATKINRRALIDERVG